MKSENVEETLDRIENNQYELPKEADFRNKENCSVQELLLYETNRLKQLCNKWETNLDRLQKSNSSSKDEIEGEISSAIGKTKILLNGRFNQMRSIN